MTDVGEEISKGKTSVMTYQGETLDCTIFKLGDHGNFKKEKPPRK